MSNHANTAAMPPTHDTCDNPPQERAYEPRRPLLRLPGGVPPRPPVEPAHRRFNTRANRQLDGSRRRAYVWGDER